MTDNRTPLPPQTSINQCELIGSLNGPAAGVSCHLLEQLARDLLDPEMFGHAVTPEIRNAARRALGMEASE